MPLLNVATTVFAPEFNCEERIFTSVAAVFNELPFTVHETVQVGSLATTAKAFEALAAAATRAVDVEGELEVKLQLFCTVKFQAHVVVS